ncbi:MAG: 4Fe-4S dicluster domain-containing protein, partial [Methanobrevibacter sp.]|nr:4Fe-4S dicluster domain-containing protein [Methanobrevibacter sp.]
MGIFSFFKRNKSEEKTQENKAESHIEINTENCKACQRCVSVCPNNSFLIKDGKSS